MPSLTTVITIGTATLLAVPVLALAAPTETNTCVATVAPPPTARTGTPSPAQNSPAQSSPDPLDAPGCTPSRDPVTPGAPIQLPPGYSPPPGTHPQAARAIAWALAQLGTPYSYGGDCTAPHSDDPRRRCDCSSLTQIAYRNGAGITLPRTTFEQVRAGRPVNGPADLQPGDLVFIAGSTGTPQAPGHVALAIGAGLLIQAPRSGETVRLTPVAEWAGLIVAIRRMVEPLDQTLRRKHSPGIRNVMCGGVGVGVGVAVRERHAVAGACVRRAERF